jgi:V/A-type H+/Na+-transporting ATPase subunit I
MTVARMKKVRIYAHASLKEGLVEALHDQGRLHIVDLHNLVEDESPGLSAEEIPDTRELGVRISKAAFLNQFLSEHAPEKPSFMQNLIKEMIEVTSEEYYSIEGALDFDGIYEESGSLDAELFRIRERLKQIDSLKKELEQWRALAFPLKDAQPTRSTQVLLGKVPVRKAEDLRRALDESSPLVHAGEVSRDALNARFMIICHRDAASEVEEILSAHDFSRVELLEVARAPQQEIESLEEEEGLLREEREAKLERAAELSAHRPQVLLYHEYLLNERRKREVVSDFAHTSAAFVIEGWIRASDEESLRWLIESESDQVEVESEDPGPEEKPPTATEQPRWRKPLWLLTRLYGPPDYREFDPTAAITPFFIVFFGMCLGDFGYGVVFSLLCWQARKRLKVGPKAKDFLMLLVYGGISTAFFGILGGSYFGIDIEIIPGFLRKLAILLPIENKELGIGDPYPFLFLALGLGVLQLVLGYVIEMVDNMRNGRVRDAIYDQASMLGLVAGIGVLAVGKLASISALTWIGVVVALASALLTIATGGRESKSIFGRLANGIFSLYNNAVGFFGDTLSYVRLFALGLATMLVAFVVNEIGKQVLGIPVLGYVLIVVVAVGGHTFNLAISLLSAFIHPLRLQYVEFFSKFYEDGAKPFEPFRVFSDKLIFKDREQIT